MASPSKSPMMVPSLPITPKPTENAIASAVPSLDDKVEYMDLDGNTRRSETITRRMILRGHSISHALVLGENDQAHRSSVSRAQETKDKDDETALQMRELEKKQKANAAFKKLNKDQRQQWIDEGDELIATRLQLSYDGRNAPPEDDQVDTTELNTGPTSPSKKAQVFIDPFGNLRRKSAPKIVEMNPPEIVAIDIPSTSGTDGKKCEESSSQPTSPTEATRPADLPTKHS